MSGIKYILQKDLFDEEDAKVLCVLSVCKTNAKKSRPSAILALNSENSTGITRIALVKIQDKGIYKKKQNWHLDELKIVDVRQLADHEFDLTFEKKFEWAALNLNEKKTFLSMLWRYVNKSSVITTKALFKNIPEDWNDESTTSFDVAAKMGKETPDEEIGNVEFDDCKELAELEKMLETDFKLVDKYSSAMREFCVIVLFN